VDIDAWTGFAHLFRGADFSFSQRRKQRETERVEWPKLAGVEVSVCAGIARNKKDWSKKEGRLRLVAKS
jgi:hypothetical protein